MLQDQEARAGLNSNPESEKIVEEFEEREKEVLINSARYPFLLLC